MEKGKPHVLHGTFIQQDLCKDGNEAEQARWLQRGKTAGQENILSEACRCDLGNRKKNSASHEFIRNFYHTAACRSKYPDT